MLREWYIREFLRGMPTPPVRKIDGTVNEAWVNTKALLEDRHVSQEEAAQEIAHEERIIDEMLGLRPTPQYPLLEDKELTFHEP
jgi:hypothetical protein